MGVVTPMSSFAEGFTRWLSNFALPYEPLAEQLSDHFGALFYLQHTGGGGMAIEAWHEGIGILITDADGPLSVYADRMPGETGYAVGVYAIETYQIEWPPEADVWHTVTELSEEPIGWASSRLADTVDQLIRLIELALESVATFNPDQDAPYKHISDSLMEA